MRVSVVCPSGRRCCCGVGRLVECAKRLMGVEVDGRREGGYGDVEVRVVSRQRSLVEDE